jgi:hypothetical protein
LIAYTKLVLAVVVKFAKTPSAFVLAVTSAAKLVVNVVSAFVLAVTSAAKFVVNMASAAVRSLISCAKPSVAALPLFYTSAMAKAKLV